MFDSKASLFGLRKPLKSAGFWAGLSMAAAVAVFGGINAASAGSHPDTACNKSGFCKVYQNNGSGPALEAASVGANTRALYVYATNSGADGTDINGGYIGIIGRAPAGGGTYPIALTDQYGNNLFFVDGVGDVFYHGSLNQFAHTRNGQQVLAFSPQSTSRTIEDVGSARLVNGQATVILDRTFASSIDMQSAYHVFLTPNGDTRGLYVAQKSANTFIVRETQGGHGSLAFDYRIVGSAVGHSGERMGATTASEPRARPSR